MSTETKEACLVGKIIEAEDNVLSQIKTLNQDKEIGIVIIDQKTLDKVNEQDRKEIEASIDPVFIPISTELSQDSLKKLIKKSIGVDLYR